MGQTSNAEGILERVRMMDQLASKTEEKRVQHNAGEALPHRGIENVEKRNYSSEDDTQGLSPG